MHKPFLFPASLLITSSLVGCGSAPEQPHHTTNNIKVQTINGVTYTTQQPIEGVEITQIRGKHAYGTEMKASTIEGKRYLLKIWKKNLADLKEKLKADPNNEKIKRNIHFEKSIIKSTQKCLSILEKKRTQLQNNPKTKGATAMGSVRFTGSGTNTYAKSGGASNYAHHYVVAEARKQGQNKSIWRDDTRDEGLPPSHIDSSRVSMSGTNLCEGRYHVEADEHSTRRTLISRTCKWRDAFDPNDPNWRPH